MEIQREILVNRAVNWKHNIENTNMKSAVQKALDGSTTKKDDNFYQGKMFTLRYFFAYELPKTQGLVKRLLDDDRLTVEMQTNFFSD